MSVTTVTPASNDNFASAVILRHGDLAGVLIQPKTDEAVESMDTSKWGLSPDAVEVQKWAVYMITTDGVTPMDDIEVASELGSILVDTIAADTDGAARHLYVAWTRTRPEARR